MGLICNCLYLQDVTWKCEQPRGARCNASYHSREGQPSKVKTNPIKFVFVVKKRTKEKKIPYYLDKFSYVHFVLLLLFLFCFLYIYFGYTYQVHWYELAFVWECCMRDNCGIVLYFEFIILYDFCWFLVCRYGHLSLSNAECFTCELGKKIVKFLVIKWILWKHEGWILTKSKTLHQVWPRINLFITYPNQFIRISINFI